MKIPLAKIKLLRQHLRRDLDPEQLRSLAADMQRHGQIQPIAVRKLDDDEWELIAGRRRLEAAKLLNWSDIEGHELTWEDKAELPALAENLKRTQLTPLEEADSVLWMHTEGNMSIGEIAEKTGHGTSWVQDRLAVGNLPENLKQAVHARTLSISAALLLSEITDTDYRDYLLH